MPFANYKSFRSLSKAALMDHSAVHGNGMVNQGKLPLYHEVRHMIASGVLMYTLPDVRDMIRKGETLRGDPARIERVLRCPCTALDVASLFNDNMERLKEVASEEHAAMYNQAMDLSNPDLPRIDILCFDDERGDQDMVYSLAVNHRRKLVSVVFRGTCTTKDLIQDAKAVIGDIENPLPPGNGPRKLGIHLGFKEYLYEVLPWHEMVVPKFLRHTASQGANAMKRVSDGVLDAGVVGVATVGKSVTTVGKGVIDASTTVSHAAILAGKLGADGVAKSATRISNVAAHAGKVGMDGVAKGVTTVSTIGKEALEMGSSSVGAVSKGAAVVGTGLLGASGAAVVGNGINTMGRSVASGSKAILDVGTTSAGAVGKTVTKAGSVAKSGAGAVATTANTVGKGVASAAKSGAGGVNKSVTMAGAAAKLAVAEVTKKTSDRVKVSFDFKTSKYQLEDIQEVPTATPDQLYVSVGAGDQPVAELDENTSFLFEDSDTSSLYDVKIAQPMAKTHVEIDIDEWIEKRKFQEEGMQSTPTVSTELNEQDSLETDEENPPTKPKQGRKFEIIIDQMKQVFAEHPDYRLTIGGHSMGGALATLFAFECGAWSDDEIPKPVTCITCGASKPGNNDFLNAFIKLEKEKKVRCLHVANHRDFVTVMHLPMCCVDRQNFRRVGMHLIMAPRGFVITYTTRRPYILRVLLDTMKWLRAFFIILSFLPFVCLCGGKTANYLLTEHSELTYLDRMDNFRDVLEDLTIDELYETRFQQQSSWYKKFFPIIKVGAKATTMDGSSAHHGIRANLSTEFKSK